MDISYAVPVRFLFHFGPRWIAAILFGITAKTAVAQIYTDPFGYHTMVVPGSSHGLVSIFLVNGVGFTGTVSEVTEAGVRFTSPISSSVFGSVGLGFADVRQGVMAGLAIPSSGIEDNFLKLERSPVGLIAPGDVLGVRRERTIGETFGVSSNEPLQPGPTAADADTLGLWDPATQSSRVFYLRTGEGWREAGKENEGDKGATPIRFPSAVILGRRSATPLTVVLSGAVPVPWTQRFHPVWPGRNLISAPFSAEATVTSYLTSDQDGPWFVTEGTSAPKADTLRFTLADGSLSPVMYFRKDAGWRTVGSEQPVDSFALDFSKSLELQRIGGTGYVKFNFSAGSAAAAAQPLVSSDVEEVAPQSLGVSAEGMTLVWAAQPGEIYQVQSRPVGSTSWSKVGENVSATSTIAKHTFHCEGSGLLRIIKP